ncbi:MAG: DUF5681 domain-containing protein [Amphiplicatus sp.]
MTDSNDETRDYEVGYGKPPRRTQFKKGQSGNPKGRPKGKRNLKTDVRETLQLPVSITENGRKRKVSTQTAVLLRLREKALQADAKAIDRIVALAHVHNNEEFVEEASEALSSDDAMILDLFAQRLMRDGRTGAPSLDAAPEESNEGACAHASESDLEVEPHGDALNEAEPKSGETPTESMTDYDDDAERRRAIEEAWRRSGLADEDEEDDAWLN